MSNLRKSAGNNRGSALLIAMGMVFLVGATTSGLFYQGITHSRFGERTLAQTRALELANSGLELARYTLRHSASDCFSSEISSRTIFDRIPLGDDGHFRVEVFAIPNDSYTARVVSTGTYTLSDTKTQVEAKMTCGYLSALDSYAIVSGGDLFVSGSVTVENGDYEYNGIHAEGTITFLGSVELPSNGFTITQTAPVTTPPPGGAAVTPATTPPVIPSANTSAPANASAPAGVTVTQTTTPPVILSVNAAAFEEHKTTYFPGIAGKTQYNFKADGSVTDGDGQLVQSACLPCTARDTHSYKGVAYTPPPAGSSSDAAWSVVDPSAVTENATYRFKDVNLNVTREVGTDLNPFPILLVVENGNLTASKKMVLTGLDDMQTKISRPLSILVEGTSTFEKGLSLHNTTLVNGGATVIAKTLNLADSALITSDDVTLAALHFEESYDGSPIIHNEEKHGDMLKKEGVYSEYSFGERVAEDVTVKTPLQEKMDRGQTAAQ
ncbi:MAG: hypothetical protein HY587_07280 [Candidatus Omnitrophica bacterium]|nr:hypothetical protein [Candidatus Omnitrophota bacterium]